MLNNYDIRKIYYAKLPPPFLTSLSRNPYPLHCLMWATPSPLKKTRGERSGGADPQLRLLVKWAFLNFSLIYMTIYLYIPDQSNNNSNTYPRVFHLRSVKCRYKLRIFAMRGGTSEIILTRRWPCLFKRLNVSGSRYVAGGP